MAFARQLTGRHTLKLAAFSLPAVLACLVLPLIAHGHNADLAAPMVMDKPLASTVVSAVPTGETPSSVPIALSDQPLAETMTQVEISPQAEPSVKLAPDDGFAPTAALQPPEITVSQPHAIIVQEGHTLWGIARETYGYGRDYPVIVEANRDAIANPELIHPGQQLVLPDKKAN